MNLLKKDKECACINFHLGNLVLTYITDYITVPIASARCRHFYGQPY